MARCDMTLTAKVHNKWLAWAAAYALAPAVFLGLRSEARATKIAMRFIRVTTKIS